jgi:hypothetical protein
MAKLKGKGTTLQQTISATLTDVAQVTDIDLSGEASLDFDSTTLDGGVFETKDLTGYSSPGTVKAGLFFDPALAGHQAIITLISTPASCVWKLKYSDSGPSSLTYTSAGVGVDQTIVANDGVKATVTMNRTGAPTRA